MARSAGLLAEQRAKLRIGSINDLCAAVKACTQSHGRPFRPHAQALTRSPDPPKAPGEAATGVFVQIGMPAGDERHTEPPAEPCAQQPKLAGAGDMDDVGLELSQRLTDLLHMAHKEGIEGKVLFEPHRPVAAIDFQHRDATFRLQGLIPRRAGTKAKHRDLVTLRERDKLAGRVRYAVDLVEAIRKEGNARHALSY